jgi:hypothetical protein
VLSTYTHKPSFLRGLSIIDKSTNVCVRLRKDFFFETDMCVRDICANNKAIHHHRQSVFFTMELWEKGGGVGHNTAVSMKAHSSHFFDLSSHPKNESPSHK